MDSLHQKSPRITIRAVILSKNEIKRVIMVTEPPVIEHSTFAINHCLASRNDNRNRKLMRNALSIVCCLKSHGSCLQPVLKHTSKGRRALRNVGFIEG